MVAGYVPYMPSFFWVYLHRHVGIVYGGNWFEEHIRVFISAKHYENLIMDIFQSEDIFSKQYYFIDTI